MLRIITKLPIVNYIPNEQELADLDGAVSEALSDIERKVFDYLMGVDLVNGEEKETDNMLLGDWGISNE